MKKIITPVSYFIVLLSIFLLFYMKRQVDNYKIKYNQQLELYESITDTLKSYKNKNNLNVSKIKIIETLRAEDFLKINNLTGYNLRLQDLVKLQGKDIKNLKSALIVATETQYTDTIRLYHPIGGDTIVFSKSVLIDAVKTNWIDIAYGFKMGKSYLQLKTFDEFSIILKESKKGNYAEITNHNPYSTTKDMKVYNVATPRQKKIGLGYNVGFGGHYGLMNKQFDIGPYIGIGINGNLFEW